MTEPLLLAATQISTFEGTRLLTRASGFFFLRDERLFLVTSRHVVIDKPSKHFPDRIEIELHTDAGNLTRSTGLSVLLYLEGKSIWHQGKDPSGEIEVGTALLIVGFPLGFHDTLHHLPVVRQAVIASSFGLRFQGQGFFLTDARTHRGTSGAPVVMRAPASDTPEGDLPWKLLGVHSARMDMRTRDRQEDESLGLNCAWYADILMTLTEEADRPAVAGSLATLRDQDQADAKDQRVSSD